jgi:hypothetical protein
MKRVLILVEGQTEERFVKDVLCEYLWARGIDAIPKVATTKRVKCGPDFKGGITDYQKVENDLRRLLGDTAVVSVTTFIDYYALPSDFPGMSSRPNGLPIKRAQHVEKVWEQKIGHDRFRAYLMIHEYEALLFTKPEELSTALYQPSALPQLQAIRTSFTSPEDINDNPLTAPSKRILQLLPGYQKTLHGPLVTKRVGLATLRSECPHFNEWLSWLENL